MKKNREIQKKKSKSREMWIQELESRASYDRQSIASFKDYIHLLQCCGNCKFLKTTCFSKTCLQTFDKVALHHKCDYWRPSKNLRNDVMTYWP